MISPGNRNDRRGVEARIADRRPARKRRPPRRLRYRLRVTVARATRTKLPMYRCKPGATGAV